MDDVLIFDGVCNLCAHSVKFILRHEASPKLRFAPVQSADAGAARAVRRELALALPLPFTGRLEDA